MSKKLLGACMALAAFMALAVVPATASATNDPEITHPTGTLLVPGVDTTIKATNVGETTMTDANTNGLVHCTVATMTGRLTKNDGSNVEGNITSATFAGTGAERNGEKECTSSFGGITVNANPATNGLPWCIRSTSTMATDEFQVRGNECSKAARPIRFILESTTIGSCTYQRTTAIPGTFTTDVPADNNSDALMHISHVEFPKFEGSFLCPSAGYLDMTFTMETDTTASADPLYFS